MKKTIAIALIFLAGAAYATGNSSNNPDIVLEQDQDQYQKQDQGQYQKAQGGDAMATGTGTATNEGIDIDASENNSIENNSSNTVLVPNNNTENCLRVFGIAWGKGGESGALGLPWRSKKCDYEQAADDAFSAGERDTGWFWKCENPNLYKSFKSKGESKESAKTDCLSKMTQGVNQTQMIAMLREDLDQLQERRENDLEEYRRQLDSYKDECNESKNRIAETCRQSK